MELKFDNNRKRVSICPCGKSNKDGKFTPFKDYDDKGYCHSCAESFFPNEGTISDPVYTPKQTKFKLIETSMFEDSLGDYNTNHFALFLASRFNKRKAKSMIDKYYIGTYESKVIFWQIKSDDIKMKNYVKFQANKISDLPLSKLIDNYLTSNQIV